MKSCLIMGSGRSGTSMMAGILHEAGYYMGDNLYDPLPSNPKGFFENAEINGINEDILAYYDNDLNTFHSHSLRRLLYRLFRGRRWMPASLKKHFTSTIYCPDYAQRWLMALPLNIDVSIITSETEHKIKTLLRKKPFAYKDPRFSYTLPVWNKCLDESVVYICIFRDPNITVKSILKECASRMYLYNLDISEDKAYHVWEQLYSHILYKHFKRYPNQFIFVHYNQLYDTSAIPFISECLQIRLTGSFVEKNLQRTFSNDQLPEKTGQIYSQLCHLAGYHP